MAADSAGRVLVADTRGDELLVFGTDPLILRQRYPVRDAPYGLAGSSRLAWVSQTATNTVVGYDLATGIPVEKVRYPTVQQPNSLAFDEASGTLYVVSGSGAGVQVIAKRRWPMTAMHRGRMPAGWEGVSDLSDEYEWMPLRLPPDLTRISASTRLSIEAEYRGWELTRVRLYTDGSRRVLLRRKKTAADRLGIAGPASACDVPRAAAGAVPGRPRTHPHLGFRVLARRHRGTAGASRAGAVAGAARSRCWPARCSACGFAGPLGLAAGFDKDGTGLNTWGALGFGYAEVGTVTAQAQPGNPPPRMFRLPDDRALLNRMGFNNHGAGELALRLARAHPDVPIGVNIGKTKVDPARGRGRRLRRKRPAGRAAGGVPGGQRQLAEHTGTARPAGRRVAAAHPRRRAGGDDDTGAGQDRAGPVRRRCRRDRRSGSRIGLGRHRRDQHHGVARRARDPRRRRTWAPAAFPVRRSRSGPRRCCAGCTGGSATGWC